MQAKHYVMDSKASFRIFLVDDDPFCLNMYEQYLSNLGYSDVTLFESGSACLNSLLKQPDIIFLDYNMGSLNGIDVLKQVKQFNSDIYVVLLSGHEDSETSSSFMKYGAFDQVVKGVNEFDAIKKILEKITQIKILLENNSSIFKRFPSSI
jgi:DNA-binding NtrC family response regulator